MMKKAILFIFSALTIGSANSVFAQSFTIEKDTAKIAMSGYNDVKNKLTNSTTAPLNISWKIKYHNLPSSFISSPGFGICDNSTCINFSSSATIYTDSYDALAIAANDVMNMKLQIDVTTLPAPGPYFITASLTDKANPVNTRDMTFEIYKFATGISTVNRTNDDVVIYPNPARTELNVLFDGNAGIKNITVYNLIGKAVTVYKVAGNSANLDITGIPSGIYFIRLIDAQGHVVATRKFTHQ